MLNPGRGPQRIRRIALEIALLDRLRIANHLPAITGKIRTMNDDHANRSVTRCLLVFVSPTAVVGKSLALEKLFIFRWRLAHDHERYLSLYVNARIVIPVV